MQDYNNMEIKELAQTLLKLDDNPFCDIIKSLAEEQLKEILNFFENDSLVIKHPMRIDKMMRIVSEINYRKKNDIEAITNQENITGKTPQKLHLEPTKYGIAPTPNLILRSSLFSASKTHGAHDNAVRDFKIATYGGKSEILLTAFRQFNQLDLDLLLELIKLQQSTSEHLLKVSVYQLAKNTKGYGEGKQTYLQIKEQIELLTAAKIKIKSGRYEFFGGILNNAFFDNEEHLYIIEFNSKLTPLFQKHNWTGIDTNIRKKLKTNLAKWLHGFYSSHLNSNIPIKLETIYELSGATDKDISRWIRVRVTNALENLKQVFIDHGKKFEYKIKDQYLFVTKTQTLSQNKNLKKKLINKNK